MATQECKHCGGLYHVIVAEGDIDDCGWANDGQEFERRSAGSF